MAEEVIKPSEEKKRVNLAYIDAANLDRALRDQLKWKLDYKKFRVWLTEKYKVERAYLFIGLIPKYKNLYTHLQDCGFILIYSCKPAAIFMKATSKKQLL
jgi:hypothetical protein